MPVDTAVIGAGTVSGIHLSGIAKNPRTNLVGVCDVDENHAREAANEYDIDPYFDVDELLADRSLDWLHVCTPVQTHLEIAKKAITAGVPLLIEKPVTETVEEIDELVRLSEEHDVPISPVHQHLFKPAIIPVRDLIQSGELGQIRAVDLVFAGNTPPDAVNRGSWVFDLPGGEFEEGLPHPFYLLLGLGGYPAARSAVDVSTTLSGDYEQPFTYDSVQLQYVTESNTLCSATVLGGGRPKREITVHGTEQSITIDNHLQMTRVIDSDYTRSPVSKTKRALRDAGERLTGITRNARMVFETALSDDWETEKVGTSHYELFDRTAKALENDDPMPVPLSSAQWTIYLMHETRNATTTKRENPVLQTTD